MPNITHCKGSTGPRVVWITACAPNVDAKPKLESVIVVEYATAKAMPAESQSSPEVAFRCRVCLCVAAYRP